MDNISLTLKNQKCPNCNHLTEVQIETFFDKTMMTDEKDYWIIKRCKDSKNCPWDSWLTQNGIKKKIEICENTIRI